MMECNSINEGATCVDWYLTQFMQGPEKRRGSFTDITEEEELAAAMAATEGGGGGGGGSGSSSPQWHRQGLALVHFLAQRKRLLWDRGCT